MARKASKVMQQLPAHASTKFLGGTVRPITKAALGGVVGCALVMGGAGVASGALSNILKIQGFSEDLTMTPSTVADEVFDSARAKITIDKETDSITTFTVRVTGIDPSAAGQTFGSHLHSGPCIEGSGALRDRITTTMRLAALVRPALGPKLRCGSIWCPMRTAWPMTRPWFALFLLIQTA
jgi:hypothetical protein